MQCFLIQKSERITIDSDMIRLQEIRLEDFLVVDLTSILKTSLEAISSLDSLEAEEVADAGENEEVLTFSYDIASIWQQ